jgi:hypothetical protein
VPVRALLSNCDTARKVASHAAKSAKQGKAPITREPFDGPDSDRDEAAAKVLPVGLFTTLQVLFLCLLFSPPLAGFLALLAFAEIGEFFMTAHLWEFVFVGLVMYVVALALPFADLLIHTKIT